MKAAADTKPGLQFWANNEDFTPDFKSADMGRFKQQLDITAKYAEKHISFSFCHYRNPDMGATKAKAYEAYKHYFETGKLLEGKPAKPTVTVESITQALGEFSDKLEKARLVPVFRHTDPFVPMMADGRLVWRVLNNLLSNAVKYAMPGTRLYLDLMEMNGNVVISLKNISREELTADAAELMERFVRGDDSRNTEGSGLGLNIAKSLMELQKGQMQLLVDGDLFKVTLIFPGA